MSSQIRQNFHQDCEAAINRQINLELYASYVYQSMVRNAFKASNAMCIFSALMLTAQCCLCAIKQDIKNDSLFLFSGILF